MTARTFKLPPQEKAAILKVYAAARRVAVRRFSGDEAQAAAYYWTGFHVSNHLALGSPVVRAALALDVAPLAFINRFVDYHAMMTRDPDPCAAAYQEFLDLYEQMAKAA